MNAARFLRRRKERAYIRSKINHPSFSVRDQFTMIIEANDREWIMEQYKISQAGMI